MNRGLGRIERAILNLIENEGDVHGPEDLAIDQFEHRGADLVGVDFWGPR